MWQWGKPSKRCVIGLGNGQAFILLALDIFIIYDIFQNKVTVGKDPNQEYSSNIVQLCAIFQNKKQER